jgi:ATP-dependent Lon protease
MTELPPSRPLPVLPLRTDILLPGGLAPVLVVTPASIAAVEAAASTEEKLLLVGFQRDAALDEAKRSDLLDLGGLCVMRRMGRAGSAIQLLVQVLERVRLGEPEQQTPFLVCPFEVEPVEPGDGAELEGRHRAVLDQARALDDHRDPRRVPLFGPTLELIQDPIHQLFAIGSLLELDREVEERLLSAKHQSELIEWLAEALRYETQVSRVRGEVAARVDEKMTADARERLLREQLEAIRSELGESSPEEAEVAELRQRLLEADLPEHARAEATRSLERLERIPAMSPEHQVTRGHLELILELPWKKSTEDRIDLEHARSVLDSDHYGLEDVKERILEQLAVMKLNPAAKAPILCFVGPPGVGKTSLGRSIASALGRAFERVSLGGLHDESELRGHRRTYIGSMPGRILQAIQRTEVNNPLLMLDEIDKLGRDFRGDPAAALLEILDPSQNTDFHDNYLDLAFDLSRVFFITTANTLESIPGPLLDRMEVVPLAGYTTLEKREIAKRYLIPRQLDQAGLDEADCTIGDHTIDAITRSYTREAGVRELERQIGHLVRKVAFRRVQGDLEEFQIGLADLKSFLGPERMYEERSREAQRPGVAAGLAWTEAGGEVLYVEAVLLPEGSDLTLTGQLGDVMRESVRAARSYIWSEAKALAIEPDRIGRAGVHIHVPAGAIPKDGPSAGVTMATALVSLYSNRPVAPDVAMTGEITLTGLVLPVGGIREKVLAAHRAGLRRVILPARCEADLEKLPESVLKDLDFVLVSRVEEVFEAALLSPKEE